MRQLGIIAPFFLLWISFGLLITVVLAMADNDGDNDSCPSMFYRTLGNTGMITSVLSFGFWATFGVKKGLRLDEGDHEAAMETTKTILRVARQSGINLFDNAEAYGEPFGEAEKIFGQAYQELLEEDADLWRRSDVLITTKIYWGGDGQNERGLSRKHIFEGVQASLQRMKLDYVDLLFCHRPDSLTSTELVVRAMTDVVRSGKTMAWGTSEWTAQQITEAYWIAQLHGLEPPVMEQPQYHMFSRDRMEQEYYPLFKAPYYMATTIFSPLASGLLTGKYKSDIPDGTRAAQPGYEWLHGMIDDWRSSGKFDQVDQLAEYARQQFDCTVTQLAIAWCIKNPNVSTVLLGATKVEQLEDNLGAIRVAHAMTAEHLAEIEDILGNNPGSWGMTRYPNPTI